MDVRFVLTVFALSLDWRVAEANCGRVGYQALCYEYPGVSYTNCRSSGGSGGGAKQGQLVTLIDCRFNQETSFTNNPQKFKAPDGVVNFIITELFISEGVEVQIGRLICPNQDDCTIMRLTAEARAPLVFRTNSDIFRIHATGEGVTLKFTCSSNDRQCTKQPEATSRRTRMVNGVIAKPHEFPFMARLIVYYTKNPSNPEACNSNGYISDADTQANCANGNAALESINCGGSIIHENWILTAAHCVGILRLVDSDILSLLGALVIVGDHLRDEEDPKRRLRWVPPSRVTTNRVNTPSRNNNDIALLNVRPSIEIDETSRYPICLPPPYMKSVDLASAEAIAAGWGSIENAKESKELRKGDFDIISNAACQAVYSRYDLTITDNMICIINNETHPCFGDGGGPSFCTSVDSYYYEVGIMSFGSKDRETVWALDEPTGNTRVTQYIDWIKATILPDDLP